MLFYRKKRRIFELAVTPFILIFLIFFPVSCSGSNSGSAASPASTASPSQSPAVSPTPAETVTSSPAPAVTETVTPSPSPALPQPQGTLPQESVTVGSATITAEIADDDEERGSGLSWRTSLGENDGMLFVFEQKDIYSMWMYGMQFPLDVIWINDDTVVDISENVPAPENPFSADIPSYRPKAEINYFLEVNAGYVNQHGIKTGDKVKIGN